MSVTAKARAALGVISGDPDRRWRLAQIAGARWIPGFEAFLGENRKRWSDDPNFLRLALASGAPRKQWERLFVLWQFSGMAARLGGDFVECGTYEGASAVILAEPCPGLLHLFDSWEGLSSPSGEDGAYWAQGDLHSALSTAQGRLSNHSRVRFHPGWIPEEFRHVSSSISFLHLDVDLYQPTLDSLEYFWPRLLSGGVVVCDDYGFTTCPGAKKAVDDFFADVALVIHLPTGQAVIQKGQPLP